MHAVLVPVYLLLITPITLSWWAYGRQLVMDPRLVCKKTKRLRGKMAEICKQPDLIEQISLGVERAQKECQYQFRHRRWNCTSSRSIRKVLLRDTRETGFVNAILAAGITYQVTRACTLGDLLSCSCARKKNWKNSKKMKASELPAGLCPAENINFGMKKSKEFLDTRYRKRSDMKTLVKLHNYMAGRLAIKGNMHRECKCHGLSASCTLSTCWQRMPHFRTVSNQLKDRFDGASKVIAGNDGQSFIPQDASIKPPSRTDLVYSEESPSFCLRNNTLGSFGTEGRICNSTSSGEEGCEILCCNRGYNTRQLVEEVDCKCEFSWCCEVKCQKCNKTRTISTCE